MRSQKPSATTEDYLKAILEITRMTGETLAPMGDIARTLNITPGTVTVMIRRLTDEGLVEYRPRIGCGLTGKGQRIALRTIRRHRILEAFLVEILNMDWAIVHDEAERMEHGTSDDVVDRIWDLLGRPTSDPHGASIPGVDLELPLVPRCIPLADMKENSSGILFHLPDRDPALLNAFREAGLDLGCPFTVEHVQGTDTLIIRGTHAHLTLSLNVAATISCYVSES